MSRKWIISRMLGHFNRGPAQNLPQAYKKFWLEWKSAAVPKVETKINENSILYNCGYDLNAVYALVPEEEPEKKFKTCLQLQEMKRYLQSYSPQGPIVNRRCTLRSSVLNDSLSVSLKDGLKAEIKDCGGLDHYILKNPACRLRSPQVLGFKRRILKELLAGCPRHAHDPQKQRKLLREYKTYLDGYTRDEIEWYGYTIIEAIMKWQHEKQMEMCRKEAYNVCGHNMEDGEYKPNLHAFEIGEQNKAYKDQPAIRFNMFGFDESAEIKLSKNEKKNGDSLTQKAKKDTDKPQDGVVSGNKVATHDMDLNKIKSK